VELVAVAEAAAHAEELATAGVEDERMEWSSPLTLRTRQVRVDVLSARRGLTNHLRGNLQHRFHAAAV
jgi:hypothetical protein